MADGDDKTLTPKEAIEYLAGKIRELHRLQQDDLNAVCGALRKANARIDKLECKLEHAIIEYEA